MEIVQFMASEKWGGAEKVFVEVSNELAKKHMVIALLLRNTEYRDRFSNKVSIIELQSHPTRHNPFLLWEIYSILKRKKPDIVHTHAAKASSLVGTVTVFLQLKHLATKHNARKGRVFNSLPWVTVVSEESRRSVISKGKTQVRVINNGIKPILQNIQRIEPEFTIVAIGRLDKIKGFDLLIDQVKNIHFPYHLSIVGEGDEYEKLQEKIKSCGLQGKVSLTGFCEDIPRIMMQSDLIVISSHSEGFPKVMIEALFYGNVLISTPVGGVVEVLPPMFLAKHSELTRKISEVKSNYLYYNSEFEKLKESRSEEFLLSKIISKYENVYQEMLKESVVV